jgi:endonuclease/exonuclease/phosphatase (EEP) superfamily protein YafD
LESNNFRHLSSGEPIYWPTDRNKLPDLVDFYVTKGIPCNFVDAKSCLELSSDHSPVLVTLSTQAILRVPEPRLCNRKTD